MVLAEVTPVTHLHTFAAQQEAMGAGYRPQFPVSLKNTTLCGVPVQISEKTVNFTSMKIALQYLSDSKGRTQAVQLPLVEWVKVLSRLKKYEQTLKAKSDLTDAFSEVKQLRNPKGKKQTPSGFLNAL